MHLQKECHSRRLLEGKHDDAASSSCARECQSKIDCMCNRVQGVEVATQSEADGNISEKAPTSSLSKLQEKTTSCTLSRQYVLLDNPESGLDGIGLLSIMAGGVLRGSLHNIYR